jgi:glycosyltransferase involved in cell wall biosynthesis
LKLLISSHAFSPSIGGIETVSQLLAREFHRLGDQVTVVTQTPQEAPEEFDWPVLRKPSPGALIRATQWCDIMWQNNLSVRTLWPAWLLHKSVVITHQGSYCRRPSGLDLAQRLKHAVVQATPSVAISEAVARCFRTESLVIPNPYDAETFNRPEPGDERPGDLIFLGRLVSEKGVDLLIEALARIPAGGSPARLTIVGGGPEQPGLLDLTARLGLRDRVTFIGSKTGPELAALLRQHKILVIPSRYDEPFGVVALEGIACGCAVVGSSGGGLPEAIGPCGRTFPNGDVAALAHTLSQLLISPNERRALMEVAPKHLARFHPATVAGMYRQLFLSRLS